MNKLESPLTVGVIGAGQIATENHVPILLSLDRVQVAWIADRNVERAKLVGGVYGIPSLEMPADATRLPPADVVLLAIPYGARPPIYEALASRGTAVYAEKPLARSTSEFDALCHNFPGSRLGVGFQRRSSASVRALARIIKDSLFGQLRSTRVEFGTIGARSGSYQFDVALAGGGPLFDVAVHAIDAALHVTNATSVTVRDAHVILDNGLDRHTDAVFDIDTTTSGRTTFEIFVTTLRHVHPRNTYVFEHATIVHEMWTDGSLAISSRAGAEAFRLTDAAVGGYPVTAAQVLHAHWSSFLDGVRSGTPNYASAATSRPVVEVIEQIYARAR
jgi:predicted dehydrogenase